MLDLPKRSTYLRTTLKRLSSTIPTCGGDRVEVKLRPTLDEAWLAIDAIKRRRMSRAANVWLTANPWAMQMSLRGDAVALSPWRWPQHGIAAITLDIG